MQMLRVHVLVARVMVVIVLIDGCFAKNYAESVELPVDVARPSPIAALSGKIFLRRRALR